MYVEFGILEEEYRVWFPVHDPKANTNWIAEIYGTASEIRRLGLQSAKMMDNAGFGVGWREGAEYHGSIDYIILVREAVERCRRALFGDTKTDGFQHAAI